MNHIISEEPKPVCKNRLPIIDYDTARFECPSGLGARAVIIFFMHLACWRGHPELRSGSPSIRRWYAALLHCQTRYSVVGIKVIETCTLAVKEWYQGHRNLHFRCAGMVSRQRPSAERSKIWSRRCEHPETITVRNERFQDKRRLFTVTPRRQVQITRNQTQLRHGCKSYILSTLIYWQSSWSYWVSIETNLVLAYSSYSHEYIVDTIME